MIAKQRVFEQKAAKGTKNNQHWGFADILRVICQFSVFAAHRPNKEYLNRRQQREPRTISTGALRTFFG